MKCSFSASIDNQLSDAIFAHARACHPQESCGLVILTNNHYLYRPCVNASSEPHQHFLISPEDFLSASAAGTIVALVHSHPDGPAELSAADKSARVHSACSWWLVCGDKIYCFGDEDELN
jgi:proteasome lid subunit RPN8/RPN11